MAMDIDSAIPSLSSFLAHAVEKSQRDIEIARLSKWLGYREP